MAIATQAHLEQLEHKHAPDKVSGAVFQRGSAQLIAADAVTLPRLLVNDWPDDIGMPAMDGYHVARCLRAEIKLAAALLIPVGYAREHDRISAKDAGFNHHFAKPIDIQKLLALLNR